MLTSPDARKAHEFAFNTVHCASIFCRRYKVPSSELSCKNMYPDSFCTTNRHRCQIQDKAASNEVQAFRERCALTCAVCSAPAETNVVDMGFHREQALRLAAWAGRKPQPAARKPILAVCMTGEVRALVRNDVAMNIKTAIMDPLRGQADLFVFAGLQCKCRVDDEACRASSDRGMCKPGLQNVGAENGI